MKKISKKKHLEMLIQNIPKHQNPNVSLEQYPTSSSIAADLLWNAYSLGDIQDQNIIDLACGTGILAIASSLLDAKKVLGIDIDKSSINIAEDVSNKMNLKNIDFLVKDITKDTLDYKCDTLIQNPPFGSQERSKKGIDIKFIDVASKMADVIYSFHMASTHDFIFDYFENLGMTISHEFKYRFPISKIYDFHTQDVKNVDVIVFRVENF
ncbi:METTL5 family protein [Methanobrevibacter sp. OttesenSCG-928-K11]|nr:METTL5 family protein [Methanobrevibacter sp. OttesenSCG-928-K11]MDL2270286.1 METTL5 family protein [Methanobrevibacter sp. OttesenSCG-928-I08]